MLKEISLIIPNQDSGFSLSELLENLPNWEMVPNEIIIVDSSKKKPIIPENFNIFVKKFNINLIIIFKEKIYPGHARNIGILNSTNSLIAFLDSSTHPTNKWLASGLNLMKISNCQGVWGSTYYLANAFISKVLRACTYGSKPIISIPGSIFKKDIFYKCGLFLEAYRAGEDADWMTRTKLHGFHLALPDEILSYNKLNYISIKMLIKKWFNYYTFVTKLPYFKPHKDIYFYVSFVVTLLISYNWNNFAASWDENSQLFVPNITKITFSLIVIFYIFVRGILFPIKKGTKLSFILPFNFMLITLFSFLIDATKITAFLYGRMIKK